MPRSERGDPAEAAAHRAHRGVEDMTGSLFAKDQAAGARDAAISDSERKAQIQRDIERLKPMVLAYARTRGPARLVGNPDEEGLVHGGITAADVRAIGEDAAIFTGQESGRQLSWIGPAMRAGFGLVATHFVRRSTHRVERSHGNRHTVYVHPAFRDQVDR